MKAIQALVYLGEGSLTALPYVFNTKDRIQVIEEEDMGKIKGVIKSYPNLFKWFEDIDEEDFKNLCKKTKSEMERLWDECQSEGTGTTETEVKEEEVKEEQEATGTGKRTVKNNKKNTAEEGTGEATGEGTGTEGEAGAGATEEGK